MATDAFIASVDPALAAFPEAALAASCTPSVCSGRYVRMRTGIASRGNGCMVTADDRTRTAGNGVGNRT
jgi:hypothetical protein